MVSLRTLISLVEKKESKSLRRACPISPPLAQLLPASLRSGSWPSAAGCCSPSPSPLSPGIPSRRAQEHRIAGGSLQAGQGRRWTKRGTVRSSGWVGLGQVWSGSGESRERERERERERGKKQWVGVLAFLAGFGSFGLWGSPAIMPRRRRQNENTTHAGRILCFALLGVFVFVEF